MKYDIIWGKNFGPFERRVNIKSAFKPGYQTGKHLSSFSSTTKKFSIIDHFIVVIGDLASEW